MGQLILIFNGVINGMKKSMYFTSAPVLKKIHRLDSFRQPEELVPAQPFLINESMMGLFPMGSMGLVYLYLHSL